MRFGTPERVGAVQRTVRKPHTGSRSGTGRTTGTTRRPPPTTPKGTVKSPGGRIPEVGSGGRRLRRPERGRKAQGSIGPCIRDGPPRKSYSGAGEPQDTACPRGENPGAERHLPPRSRRLVATTASQTTRGVRKKRRKRQVGPRRGNTTLTRGTAGSTLRRARKESHERRRAATPVQVARTVAAGPVRHREMKPVTNDPPRRRLQR